MSDAPATAAVAATCHWTAQAARFLIVGTAAFAFDWTVLQTVMSAGAGPLPGRVASLAASVAFTFFLNRRFTFRAARAPSWNEFSRYVGHALVGIAVNYTAYATAILSGFNPTVALVLGTALAATLNFVSFRRLFR